MTVLSELADAAKRLQGLKKDISDLEFREEILKLRHLLLDAREELREKDAKIKELEETIASLRSGDTCPICRNGRMTVITSVPHPSFAFAGVQEQTVQCSACKHSEKRMYDPNGRV